MGHFPRATRRPHPRVFVRRLTSFKQQPNAHRNLHSNKNRNLENIAAGDIALSASEVAEIDEILANVAQHLPSPYGIDEDSRWSLTAMALACRAFYEPAMNANWHTIEDVGQFFDTLPADIVFHEQHQLGNNLPAVGIRVRVRCYCGLTTFGHTQFERH